MTVQIKTTVSGGADEVSNKINSKINADYDANYNDMALRDTAVLKKNRGASGGGGVMGGSLNRLELA